MNPAHFRGQAVANGVIEGDACCQNASPQYVSLESHVSQDA
jgi:hypothetical protein